MFRLTSEVMALKGNRDKMKILVACKAIEDEINDALTRLNLDYRVIWLEGGLHTVPERLRNHMQQVMDEAEGQCDTMIFALGYCGGGMSDLTTGNYTTVVFLADDCVSVLLGSLEARIRHSHPETFFMTSGWMRHETNLIDSYNRTVEKYGKVKADRMNKVMLANYKRFGLVDTGCYDLTEAAAKLLPMAETLGLSIEPLPGDSAWLDTLLTGPWDDATRFLVLPPQSKICFDDWTGLLEQVAAVTPK